MFPELIRFGEIALHSYGFFIAVGTYLSFMYFSKQLNKEQGISEDEVVKLFIWLIVAIFVGGKFFFYLEDLDLYLENPILIFKNIGNGFVFFGSLIFAIPTMLSYFRIKKWPIWRTLDHIAITACIVHAFGRFGCFMAGCCYGIPTDLPWGISYTNPMCSADPLNIPLHPTQLYEILMISIIGFSLFFFRKKKGFDGQLFLVYLILYSIGRMIIEEFRGDEARGFVLDGWLSHSQLISMVIIALAVGLYFLRRRIKNEIGRQINE